MVKKLITRADMRAFAKVLMSHIGQPPETFDEIVEAAIEEYKKKEKEVQ